MLLSIPEPRTYDFLARSLFKMCTVLLRQVWSTAKRRYVC